MTGKPSSPLSATTCPQYHQHWLSLSWAQQMGGGWKSLGLHDIALAIKTYQAEARTSRTLSLLACLLTDRANSFPYSPASVGHRDGISKNRSSPAQTKSSFNFVMLNSGNLMVGYKSPLAFCLARRAFSASLSSATAFLSASSSSIVP